MGQVGRQGIVLGFNERAEKEYVPEFKDNSRKTEKRMTLKGKKERQTDAEYVIKEQQNRISATYLKGINLNNSL